MSNISDVVRESLDLEEKLRGLHNQYQEKLKRDDEFTIIEYMEAQIQKPPTTTEQARLEVEKLIELGSIVFSRKCLYRGKERNAYKFVVI